MRYKIIFVLIAFISQSCDRNPKVKKDELLGMSIITGGKIKEVKEAGLNSGHQIEKGQENVFIYKNKGVTFKDHVDYEPTYKEELVFEIDPSLEEFEFQGDELKNINAKYHWVLYSKDPEVKRVNLSNGRISGKKIGPDEWEIIFKIDTGLSFGSFLDKGSTHKIEGKEKVKTTGN
jgi:hypothetical protein